jgi:hypothetical protein
MIRNLVLSGGPAHDFDATSAALVDLLAGEGIESVVLTEPAEALALLRAAEADGSPPVDLLTLNALRWRMEVERYAHLRDEQAFDLTEADAALLERFVVGGGGLLALHTAVICFDAQPRWRRLCGAAWDWSSSGHPTVGPVRVRVRAAGRSHPLTAGVDDFTVTDEVYGFLDIDDDLAPLLTGHHGGVDHPLLWARQVGRGRVVTDLLGHGVESVTHPAHATILARAAVWAAGGSPLSGSGLGGAGGGR